MTQIENRRLAQEMFDLIFESLKLNLEACRENLKNHPKDADYWSGACSQAEAAISTVRIKARYFQLRDTPLKRAPLALAIDNTKAPDQ